MKRIAFALLLIPSLALAQGAPTPTTEDYQTAIQTVMQQRDAANNQVVELNVEIAKVKKEVIKFQTELAKARADLAATKPKEGKKE